jgi:hypothetical protein
MGLFRSLKLAMTGEIVQKIDAPANDGLTTMSLRLKRERSSGKHYVVLAGLSPAHKQYFSFEKGEFESFAQAVETMKNVLAQRL